MLFFAFTSFSADRSAAAAPEAAALAVSSGEIAAMVMLLGFLALIGGILFRWSSDTSWKERSVFSSSAASGPLIK
jgi:hypothetical protein